VDARKARDPQSCIQGIQISPTNTKKEIITASR
jgi:hypothetical protein